MFFFIHKTLFIYLIGDSGGIGVTRLKFLYTKLYI